MIKANNPRADMAARCRACALQNTPPNVRVIRIRKSLSGAAHLNPKDPDFGLLCAPRPVTRKALYLFLHEAGHFALHADGKHRKRYLEEMEAEQWAHARMREAGLVVPRAMTKRARLYVADKIIEAARKGAVKIDRRALKFAGPVLSGAAGKVLQRILAENNQPRPLRPKRKAFMVGTIIGPRPEPEIKVRRTCPGCGLVEVWVRPRETALCDECELELKRSRQK